MKQALLVIVALTIGCGHGTRVGTDGRDGGGIVGLGDGGVRLGDGGVIPVGDCVNAVQRVPLEPRRHIPLTQQPIYLSNPPVQGEHYETWARWQIHTTIIPRGNWVHNLEHGGVVFLYRPDIAPDVIAALVRVYNAIPLDTSPPEPCNHNRTVLVPDPLLDVSWAVTVAGPENPAPPLGDGFVIKADCIRSEQALVDFAVQYRNHSAEGICAQGSVP